MLDSWVSPEAAGFFISFMEGQNPLCLPLPLHPKLSAPLSLTLPFLNNSPCFLLSACGEPKGQLWSLTEKILGPSCPTFGDIGGVSGAREGHRGDLTSILVSPTLSLLISETDVRPAPSLLIFIEKKAGKASIWHMNN